MTKRKTKETQAKELNPAAVIIKRGIESDAGNHDNKRFEAGPEPVPVSELEKYFSKDVLNHWLKTGVLEVV